MQYLWKTFLLPILVFATTVLTATLPLGPMNMELSSANNNDLLPMAIKQQVDDTLPLLVDHDGRIIGGEQTSIANYPYQVSVQHDKSHICGGSILTPNTILTAAHCFENPRDVAAFQVRAGSSYHHRGGQLLKVRQIIKHESYTFTNLDCDVALVVLSHNLTYNRRVQPVELAPSNALVPEQEPLYVSGWGLTSETGLVSGYLNHVAVGLINRHNCTKNYQFVATITRQMFCAGYPQGGKDSCQGDSGGPLVSYALANAVEDNATLHGSSSSLVSSSAGSSPLTSLPLKSLSPTSLSSSLTATKSVLTQSVRNTRKPIQYGIVSWGVGCAQSGFPGVYADVGALRPWIDAKLREINYK